MKKKHYKLVILSIFYAISILVILSGCASFESLISQIKGELFGNDYTITEWDNYGNLNFTITGDKIALSEGTDSYGESTSYINITIDGMEWNHVGSTLVFAQNGVDMITDFQIPSNMDSNSSSSGLIGIDRTINHYKNLFGKKLVVVVSSQNGTPIGLFQGDSCYTEIPSDLPKTTLISIDGKLVYVHRANIDIIPAELFF